jgi:beta-carotene 3-hydroxylase
MIGALVAFGVVAGMEAVSYALHRFVMHGPGFPIHADHHAPSRARFERNDLYPASFSLVAIALFALGTTVPGLHVLVAAGFGMTLYGVAYVYVHDVFVHRRLPLPRPGWRVLVALERRHRLHHLYGGEPYGMLLPMAPRALRERGAADEREPFARAARTRDRRSWL